MFRNIVFFEGEELYSTSPSRQAGGLPLVASPRLLFQYIRSYPPYCRLLLHRHPEGAPCRCDKSGMMVGGIYWIDLAQNSEGWRALENAVMNLRSP